MIKSVVEVCGKGVRGSVMLKRAPGAYFSTARIMRKSEGKAEQKNVSNVTDSSTTAIEYKSVSNLGQVRPIPGVIEAPTIEQAVTHLIRNTPLAPKRAEDAYVIDCLAQDEPGVLSSVTGIMAARGFSIDTLVASKTEVKGLSRMTIGLKGARRSMEQAKKQLESLVPIWAVLDYSHTSLVAREALLVKVSLNGLRKQRSEDVDAKDMNPARRAEAMAEQFVNAQERLKAIKILADLFEARVADVGADSIVIEMFAKITRLDAFLELIRPFGILEAVRGGTMVMTRSSLARAPGELGSSAEAEQELPEEAVGEVPDLSHLPPS